jgi:hypothetical protein
MKLKGKEMKMIMMKIKKFVLVPYLKDKKKNINIII